MTPNDVKIVADNIDDFIEVPEGVMRLRKAVLTLALSGKLVPQNKDEGTAKELYSQIQSDHTKKAAVRKKEIKDRVSISLDDVPFDIPNSWEWVRGADLFSVVRGVTYGKQDAKDDASKGYLPLLRSHNIQEVGLNTNDLVFVPMDKISSQQMLKKGDILIAMSSGSKNLVGKAAQAPEDMNYSYGAFCAVIRSKLPLIAPYLGFFFSTPYYRDATALEGKGMSINNLTVGALENLLIPLPPLAEQERIVRRSKGVVMQLGDLETKKRERDEVRARLARSTMQSLGKGEAKIAFEHLAELVRTPMDLKELEGALLTLAVSGQLTPQNKKDGMADDLFKQILSKRVKTKKLVEIEDKDRLFPIPSNWSWVRLEDVFDVRDGTHDSPKYHTSGYPLVTSKNLYYGSLDFLNVKYISEGDHKKISDRSKVDRDDVLFAMIGSIGNPVIVDTDTEFSIKNVALFKYYDRKLSEPNFLLTYLRYAAQNMRAVSAGGVQSFVSLGFLRQYPFPLPPLAEQKRIVKKVEEVMSLVGGLKKLLV